MSTEALPPQSLAQVERLALLAKLAQTGLVGSLGCILMGGIFLWLLSSPMVALVWLGFSLLIVAYTPRILRLMVSPQLSVPRAKKVEWVYTAKMAITGACWGALTLLAPSPLSEAHLFALTTLILAICLGITGILAPARAPYYAFLTTALLPLTARIFTETPTSLPLTGWGILAFGAMLATVHHAFHSTISHMLRQREASEIMRMEYDVILNTASEAVIFVKQDHIVKCNQRFAEMIGWSINEIIDAPFNAWHLEPQKWQQQWQNAQQVIREGKVFTTITQIQRQDRKVFSAQLTASAVDSHDLDKGVVWVGTDITDRLKAEAELRASEERFRRLISMSSDWYWEQDTEFRLTRISGTRLDKEHVPITKLLGKRRWEVPQIQGVSAEQWEKHRNALEARMPFHDFSYQMLTDTGEHRWFSISGNPMYDEEGRFKGYHGVGTDVTERVQGAERFRHLAYHDTLTGLPNRRLMNDRLNQAITQAKRWNHFVVVMLLDLDDFKIINDTQGGHSAGDAVLVAIAQRLRQSVRESDTIARLGGDEFVILLPELEEVRDAAVVAEKVISAVREPVQVGTNQHLLGVSIGIAVFPADALDSEGIMQQADIAMYQAKRAGGSSYRFAHDPNQPSLPLEYPDTNFPKT